MENQYENIFTEKLKYLPRLTKEQRLEVLQMITFPIIQNKVDSNGQRIQGTTIKSHDTYVLCHSWNHQSKWTDEWDEYILILDDYIVFNTLRDEGYTKELRKYFYSIFGEEYKKDLKKYLKSKREKAVQNHLKEKKQTDEDINEELDNL